MKSVCDISGQNKISNNIIQCRGYNLGQNKWEIYTSPPPEIKDGKMGCYGFCVASSLIWGRWGGGGVGFAFAVPCYFVQDCSFQENCKYYVCASTIYKHSKSLYDTKHYCLLT